MLLEYRGISMQDAVLVFMFEIWLDVLMKCDESIYSLFKGLSESDNHNWNMLVYFRHSSEIILGGNCMNMSINMLKM